MWPLGLLFQHVLNRWHLLCVINSSHTFSLTFCKSCAVVMDTLKINACDFLEVFRHFSKNLHIVELSHLNRWHLLCVINLSHSFLLTFFKPCTVVMDTLKIYACDFLEVFGHFLKKIYT
jgi:aerobic-type carbon monoxide dehydrogenase small subunit (CoxS/CutS family)